MVHTISISWESKMFLLVSLESEVISKMYRIKVLIKKRMVSVWSWNFTISCIRGDAASWKLNCEWLAIV